MEEFCLRCRFVFDAAAIMAAGFRRAAVAQRQLRKCRQIIETAIAKVAQAFDLRRVYAQSEDGMLARLYQELTHYLLKDTQMRN